MDFGGLPHPWRRLRRLTHVELRWHDDGPLGETDFEASTISIRRGQDQAGRRSTCAHEVLHAERGPVPMGLAAKEEHQVGKEAARYLLPDIRAVGEAIAWSESMAEAAAELWVDEDTLRTRLKHLHPAERGYLHSRLEEEE